MISGKIRIENPLGLHLRPAGKLCGLALEYESEIRIRFRNGVYNAKSLLNVLGACISSGDEIELVCSGPDEETAFTEGF